MSTSYTGIFKFCPDLTAADAPSIPILSVVVDEGSYSLSWLDPDPPGADRISLSFIRSLPDFVQSAATRFGTGGMLDSLRISLSNSSVCLEVLEANPTDSSQ